MFQQNASNRRGFMKMLAASPLLAQVAAHHLYEKSAAAIGYDTKENVYSRLGVKTVINCRGTWTYLSGSLQFPEVRRRKLGNTLSTWSNFNAPWDAAWRN